MLGGVDALPAGVTVFEVTASETTVGRTTGVNVTFAVALLLLYEAVTVTGVLAVTAVVLAVNAAVLEPAGTVTMASVVKALALLERLTDAPPDGAAPLRVTMK